jgi:hypothetical protein
MKRPQVLATMGRVLEFLLEGVWIEFEKKRCPSGKKNGESVWYFLNLIWECRCLNWEMKRPQVPPNMGRVLEFLLEGVWIEFEKKRCPSGEKMGRVCGVFSI